MSQQDELSKFKKIISKLPEEKRKFLYKRLQSLPPDERENYIAEFNKKYYYSTREVFNRYFSFLFFKIRKEK